MKTDTQILNELANQTGYLHRLTDEESATLKEMLLIMYDDIANVCNNNDITFMLGGGSCLGAIRHNGYIPWDDDLDLMMMRSDYEKLIKLCKDGLLGDKYEIEYPNKYTDSKNTFFKIYRKGTLDNELYNENTPFPKGIFIDIFPIDYAPKNKYLRFLKGLISDSLQVISSCVLYAQYPSEKYMNFVQKSSKSFMRYKIRIAIGKILKVIPHQKWVYWFDRFNGKGKWSTFATIPTGRKHYMGESHPLTTFLPVKYSKFEGRQCPIPADYDKYLTSLYNNYMEIPSENKRERHMVYEFKCDLPI